MLYSAIRYVENTNHSNAPFSILEKSVELANTPNIGLTHGL